MNVAALEACVLVTERYLELPLVGSRDVCLGGAVQNEIQIKSFCSRGCSQRAAAFLRSCIGRGEIAYSRVTALKIVNPLEIDVPSASASQEAKGDFVNECRKLLAGDRGCVS